MEVNKIRRVDFNGINVYKPKLTPQSADDVDVQHLYNQSKALLKINLLQSRRLRQSSG